MNLSSNGEMDRINGGKIDERGQCGYPDTMLFSVERPVDIIR